VRIAHPTELVDASRTR